MMMRLLVERIKPAHGFSHLLHIGLLLVLPAVLLVFVRLGGGFVQLALSLVLLSKWRMLAVRPRFWTTNIRANSVDITVGLSAVIFMTVSLDGYMQVLWAALYAAWLVILKPGSGTISVVAQALVAQVAGLMALFIVWVDGPLIGLVFVGATICYIAARHFFDNFEEPYARLLSYIWGYIGAALIWILGHWLWFYGLLAQPTLFLCLVGFGLALLYYFDHQDRLSMNVRRYTVATMCAAVVMAVVLTWVLGGWGNKVV